MPITIRPFQPEDREGLLRVARDTAWFGEPMEKGYGESHELVALMRAEPYLEHSPEFTSVAEDNGEVVGYILGTDDTKKHHQWMLREGPKRLLQLLPSFGVKDWQLLLRQMVNGGGGLTEDHLLRLYPAHLHINLLPQAQGQGVGRRLMETFSNALKQRGVRGIHLGTSNRNEGADAFFRAMGFRLIARRPLPHVPFLDTRDGDILLYGKRLDESAPITVGEAAPATYGERRARGVHHHDFGILMPGPGIPGDAPMDRSLNNCDLIRHQGTYYLAYRTAATHFAPDGATMAILKSRDFKTWHTVWTHQDPEHDYREPRFHSFRGRLFYTYFASTNEATNFDPVGSFWMDFTDDANPTEPQPLMEPGWVPWRVRVHNGKCYLSAYWAMQFHKDLAAHCKLRLLESDDGTTFRVLAEPLAQPGVCEYDFAFLDDGTMVGAVRDELHGGVLFHSKKNDYGNWTTAPTPQRLDSPLVFRHGSRVFLVCRRLPHGTLLEGLPHWLPNSLSVGLRWGRYSLTPKRTALYELHTNPLRLEHLFNLPSKGDTAFAAIAPKSKDTHWLVNYTTHPDLPDLSWIAGQLNQTVFTKAQLTIT